MKAHELVSHILRLTKNMVVAGAKTGDIDAWAEQEIIKLGGRPYNKGYKPAIAPVPFPATMCISVNDEIAHGIPGDYIIQEGDVVNLDVGVIDAEGNCGDAALSVTVGEVLNEKRQLVKYAKRILYEAIEHVRAGVDTKDITQAIERSCKVYGYGANRRMAGHTIGKEMHMKPTIFNTFEDRNTYDTLKVGQVICIEPIITRSRDTLGQMHSNGWTFLTKDRRPNAMFEHMIEVTADGYKILTTHIEP